MGRPFCFYFDISDITVRCTFGCILPFFIYNYFGALHLNWPDACDSSYSAFKFIEILAATKYKISNARILIIVIINQTTDPPKF